MLALAALASFHEPTPFVIRPTHQCWPGAVPFELSYDLVIDVAVGLVGSTRLEAIRESWAAPQAEDTACSVMHLFVHSTPGPSVRHQRTADQVSLFLNTTDTYERLPVKVIGSFQWLNAHVRFKYVLKTDDDAWVCTHALLSTLARFPRTRLYWGKMNTRHALIADVTHHGSVHAAFADFFTGATRYSTYAFGAAYALSADVAAVISDQYGLDAAEHVHIEDVLVGELVSRRFGDAIQIRDARESTISLGYSRRKDDPKARKIPTQQHLQRLCTGPERGGKESIVVHRIFAVQVRKCAEMAAKRCACDGDADKCSGRSTSPYQHP